jgi:hypothetical protein
VSRSDPECGLKISNDGEISIGHLGCPHAWKKGREEFAMVLLTGSQISLAIDLLYRLWFRYSKGKRLLDFA